ncbi:hypothetical protein SO802_023580 [Lithocarpus litseifolius]|uniref:Uncharacterized protein n=1 Tax=Lithocarpus litseifolius TaxID=425828 RepID=A0AAW2C8L2_9ROSI
MFPDILTLGCLEAMIIQRYSKPEQINNNPHQSSPNQTPILPPEIGNLTGLKILNLAQNHLSSEISGKLPIGLNYLDLSSNAFSGVIPRSVANLTQRQLINLSYNQFSSEIPVSFRSSAQLNPHHISFVVKEYLHINKGGSFE